MRMGMGKCEWNLDWYLDRDRDLGWDLKLEVFWDEVWEGH